jgi:ATPase subunit of ABC transporter with duplicated ATPase domains
MPTSSPTLMSPRAQQVVEWFGLRLPPPASVPSPAPPPLPAPGQVLLISGPSGSGKSRLLRTFRRRTRRTMSWINLAALRLPDRPVVDCFGEYPLERTLELLNRVGLAEAWTYLRRPRHLSDGQRWRLRLALALYRAGAHHEPVDAGGPVVAPDRPSLLICDEFAALLDRITAAVVARALRRTIDAHPHLRAIVATSHDDLLRPLQPDLHMRCDFGEIFITEMQRTEQG